jgi:hypothetical protein
MERDKELGGHLVAVSGQLEVHTRGRIMLTYTRVAQASWMHNDRDRDTDHLTTSMSLH